MLETLGLAGALMRPSVSYIRVQCFAVNTVNFVSLVCLMLGMPSAVEPYPCNFLEQWIDELQLAKAKRKNGGDAAFPLLFPLVVAYRCYFGVGPSHWSSRKKTEGGGEELNSFLLVSGLKQFIGAANAQGDGAVQRGAVVFASSEPLDSFHVSQLRGLHILTLASVIAKAACGRLQLRKLREQSNSAVLLETFFSKLQQVIHEWCSDRAWCQHQVNGSSAQTGTGSPLCSGGISLAKPAYC